MASPRQPCYRLIDRPIDMLMMRIFCQAVFRTAEALDRAVTIGVPHSWVTGL